MLAIQCESSRVRVWCKWEYSVHHGQLAVLIEYVLHTKLNFATGNSFRI